jgi:subtilisin family serine protease/subtilisin-like proprotein convertase family protein
MKTRNQPVVRSFLASRFGKAQRKPRSLASQRRTPGRTARFESLESRALMAADMLQVDGAHYDPSHFLVQFRSSDATPALLGASLGGATITRQVSSDGWFQATLSTGADLNASMQAFQSRGDVLMASPDFRVSIDALPNDPSYGSQWGLENLGGSGLPDADIDAAEAWDYGTATSVVVAVIDSGIDYTHVDLASNIWTNADEVAGNGIDDDGNGYVDDVRGWNFVANNNNPMDDNGHGTHVAGTIGAVGGNGIGVTGVAWHAQLMALKFLDSTGSGMLSDAVSAIGYARANGAKIINASWGGGGFSSALQSAIQRFQNAGGIFVTAAGNESSNNAQVASYPANYALANVISVAATTSFDTLASFSNYGSNVDIAAPGQSILSTVPGNRYAVYSGTSMATPHVAGAMALLWGQAPELTAAQLIDLVMSNTDSILLSQTAHGRLNVGKAAAKLHAGSTTADRTSPYVTSANWNGSASSLTSVDITFSEVIRASSLTASTVQVSGPNGAVAIASITPLDSGTRWRVAFSTQSAAGKYSVAVLPAVADASGNLLDQDRDGVAGEATQDRFVAETSLQSSRSYTRTGPFGLQDASWWRVGVTQIAIDVPDSFAISDLNVNLSVDHTYVSDLRIRLISPSGTSVQLVNRRGGARDNLRVQFDDEATSAIGAATGDLSGTFRPETALSAFDGQNARGRWTLEVTDVASWDVGKFNSLTLQFNSGSSSAASSGGTSGSPTVPAGGIAPPTISGPAAAEAWLNNLLGMLDAWWRRRI